MNLFRPNDLAFSDEVTWMLEVTAKSLVSKDGKGAVTPDQLAENIVREKLTTDNPNLVVLYEEFQTAKNVAKMAYKDIERRASSGSGVPAQSTTVD